MQKQQGSVDKVNSLCVQALKITQKDLIAVDKMAKEQTGYVNPLKGAKQSKFNELGNHNQRVLFALQNLINVIKSGDPGN